jgi:transposase
MRKYKRYNAEFKREAVRLLESGDKPAAEVAIELGIRRTQLYKWQRELHRKGEAAFRGRRGRKPQDQEAELTRLRRELERVTEERDILKKAAAYFARDSR